MFTRKILCYIIVFSVSLTLYADFKNLIANGNFAENDNQNPLYWYRSLWYGTRAYEMGTSKVKLIKGIGPNGLNCLKFNNYGTLRQRGIILIPGKKYRLSAYIKTSDFKSKARIVVYGHPWQDEKGIKQIPENSAWKRIECIFTAFKSKNGIYGVAIHVPKGTSGSLWVTDLKLEAMNEKTNDASFGLCSEKAGFLVPIKPLLDKIPAKKAIVYFKWFGASKKYLCKYNAGNLKTKTVVLESGKLAKIDLSGLPKGKTILNMKIVSIKNQSKVFDKFQYSITLCPEVLPEFKSGIGKRLNSLVVELINKDKVSTNSNHGFENPRSQGWIFISTPPKAKIILDGKKRASFINPSSKCQEAFCNLHGGKHSLKLTGDFKEGKLIVRAVPELLGHVIDAGPYVPYQSKTKFDYNYLKKYRFPSVTSYTHPVFHSKAVFLQNFQAFKFAWYNYFSVNDTAGSADKILQKLLKFNEKSKSKKRYNGIVIDEVFPQQTELMIKLSDALYKFREINKNTNIAVYSGDIPFDPMATELLSAAMNSAGGNGRMFLETYCVPKPDIKKAKKYLQNHVLKTTLAYARLIPGSISKLGVIFCFGNQIPLFSIAHLPNVDARYYLDMQFNILANHSGLKALGTVGYWGNTYADDEMNRFAHKVIRHYAVEGRKDMYSKSLGLSYILPYLKNCDFNEGLKNWTVTGDVSTASHPGLGRHNQGRWRYPGGYDNFCVLSKTNGKTASVTQTAKGLIPGKLYSLQFIVSNLDEVKNKKFMPSRYAIDVSLPGIEIIKDKSYVYVDIKASNKYPYRNRNRKKMGAVNVHRIVFRAKNSEQKLIFSNSKAKDGEKLIFNFVKLQPWIK